MKFLDLFAGIGGFRRGLTRQGHECIGFCEIDKFATKSYKAIYETEGEIEFHDIRQVTDQDFRQLRGQMDIIVFYFSKMSKAYSVTTRERHFEQSSPHWMSWGMMLNGRCLTVKISKCRKTVKEFLLSDILEDTVLDSYFLSEEKVAQLVLND